MVKLPQNAESVYLMNCASLTNVAKLPGNITYANFYGCTRLRRVKRLDARFIFDNEFDPAQDVHTLMVSGVSNLLLSVGIGPDAALLIARFATPGMTAQDRMETMQQVRARYGIRG